MKKNLVLTGILLALLALYSTGCGGAPPEATPVPPTEEGAPAPPPPAGECQSKVWGKVINQTDGQGAPEVTVKLEGGDLSIEAVTDANGLYGFAGLCAGEYVVNVVPPEGAKAVSPVQTVTLDGSNTVTLDLAFER